MATIIPIDTPTLGDRSYLAHDGQVAIVIDPQRDIDRVLDLANDAGVTITHVFETHIHNDYVTGGYALAQATGAAYHVNAADDVSYERVPVSDGDVLDVSPALRVRVIATPGHTSDSISFLLPAESALLVDDIVLRGVEARLDAERERLGKEIALSDALPMLENLGQDYVRTARAKGLTESSIAEGLLKAAIRCEDPVVFLESQLLYDMGEQFEPGGVPEGYYETPEGTSVVRREGTDLTIATFGATRSANRSCVSVAAIGSTQSGKDDVMLRCCRT